MEWAIQIFIFIVLFSFFAALISIFSNAAISIFNAFTTEKNVEKIIIEVRVLDEEDDDPLAPYDKD